MKKNLHKKDVLGLLASFQNEINSHSLTKNQMLDEVRLMHFRVRPMQGNWGGMDLTNTRFVEALWSLGKLDELYHREVSKFPKKDQAVFFRYMHSLHATFTRMLQDDLAAMRPKNESSVDEGGFEVEVFRQFPDKSQLN